MTLQYSVHNIFRVSLFFNLTTAHDGNGNQNSWGWKGPLKVWSTYPAQTGLATELCPGLCPNYFSIHEWRLHDLSEQPVPVLGHSPSKKPFPDIQMEPPVFQFVPIASGPVTGCHWREPVSVFFAPTLQGWLNTLVSSVCHPCVSPPSPRDFSCPG